MVGIRLLDAEYLQHGRYTARETSQSCPTVSRSFPGGSFSEIDESFKKLP